MQLLFYGKDWPGEGGYNEFRSKCKAAFLKNSHVTEEEEINKLIARGEFVVREIDALYKLKKYRTIRRRYEYE